MKKQIFLSLFCLTGLILTFSNAQADSLVGVDIEEVVTISPGGEELRLRGAGVKNSARQALYVGGLYLQDDSSSASEILDSETTKRFVLFCEDSSIKPDALIRALNMGITANHGEQELIKLEPMIKQFNEIWNSEINEGDRVWVDYLPGIGTSISINGVEKGLIPGKEFYSAFLKTWIGDKPLNQSMKKQLLGKN